MKENASRNYGLVVVLPALLAAIAIGVYSNSLKGGFVYDDHFLVESYPLLKDFSAEGIFKQLYHQRYGNYLPLRFISYTVDYKIWGMNPLGFHITNIALHAINVVLAFFLALAVAGAGGAPGGEDARKKFAIAAAGTAGLLWAVHPLMCESVAWISGRKDLLSTFFILISSLLYLKSFRRPLIGNNTDFLLLGSLIAYSFSVLSKATSITFPFLLVFTEFLIPPGDGQNTAKKRIERLFPFFMVFGIILALNLSMSKKAGVIHTYMGGSVFTHILTIAKIPLLYLGKLLYPRNLAVEYRIVTESSVFSPIVLASFALVAAVVFLFAILARRWKPGAWLLAWTAVFMLPVMNLIPTSKLIADRYFYNPAIGLFGLAGCGAAALAIRPGASRSGGKFPAAAACAVVLVAAVLLAARAVDRNRDWRSDLALWSAAAEVEPDNSMVHDSLGYALFMAKDYDNAKKHFERALEITPGHVSALINLGVMEYHLYNKKESAMKRFMKAVEIQPKASKAWAGIAIGYFDAGEYQMAMNANLNAIINDPANRENMRRHFMIIKKAEENGVAIDAPDFARPDASHRLAPK